MKILLLIFGLLLTTALQAQEQQLAANTAERPQPVITEAKVEKRCPNGAGDAQQGQRRQKAGKRRQIKKRRRPKIIHSKYYIFS